MPVETDELFLEKCRALIEEKLGWGSSDIWTNQDFETLSERIEQETKVKLSAVTLKRIWRKVKYESKPTITTLDTLARFMGFENWRVFKLNQATQGYRDTTVNGSGYTTEHDADDQTGEPIPATVTKPGKLFSLGVAIALLCTMMLGWYVYRQKQATTSPAPSTDYTFSSKKIVSEGVPNSVIFEYDATAAGEDTIYIQQSWDTRLREQVSREQHIHKSIYYYPGYFLAKLIVGSRIVKEHHLYIRTNGWLPLIEQPDVPVYFKEEEAIRQDGVMSLPIEKLKAYNMHLQPNPPWTSFHNVREYGDLKTDNFIFETELKNDFNEGAAICQLTEIHIRIEGGLLFIPLSIKGCVSQLMIADVDGKKADTSPLGCDFSNWVNVKLVCKNRQAELFINGEKAYDLNYDIDPVRIVGLQYRFQGTGSVNFVRLSDVAGHVVYEDQF